MVQSDNDRMQLAMSPPPNSRSESSAAYSIAPLTLAHLSLSQSLCQPCEFASRPDANTCTLALWASSPAALSCQHSRCIAFASPLAVPHPRTPSPALSHSGSQSQPHSLCHAVSRSHSALSHAHWPVTVSVSALTLLSSSAVPPSPAPYSYPLRVPLFHTCHFSV